jgi:uncharacterized protein
MPIKAIGRLKSWRPPEREGSTCTIFHYLSPDIRLRAKVVGGEASLARFCLRVDRVLKILSRRALPPGRVGQSGGVDLADQGTLVSLVASLAIVIGIIGIVVPMLPGVVLCWAGVAFWAVFGDAGPARWAVLVVATALAVLGTVVKYAVPGRNLKRAGVPNWSLFAGGVLGIIGFFVVPVVGLVLGFVLGVWLAEQLRLRDWRAAWQSTKHALKATGLSMLIELATGIGIALTFAAGESFA